MLDLRRLAVFHAVAEHGSFSGAALALDYAQSVVSHHVAQLERELGVTLFERGKRPVRLTPPASACTGTRARSSARSASAEADLRAVAGLEAGHAAHRRLPLRLHVVRPRGDGRLQGGPPGVEVRLEQHEPPASLPRLIAGELDLVVAWVQYGAEAAVDPRLDGVPLGDDPYRIVLSPGHRLARRRELRLADLAGETFIAPRPVAGGVVYRAMLDRLCPEAGFVPRHRLLRRRRHGGALARRGRAVGGAAAGADRPPSPARRRGQAVRGVEPFRTVHAFWVKGGARRRRGDGGSAAGCGPPRAAGGRSDPPVARVQGRVGREGQEAGRDAAEQQRAVAGARAWRAPRRARLPCPGRSRSPRG